MLAFDKFSGKAISKAALDIQPDVVYTDTEFTNGVIEWHFSSPAVCPLYGRWNLYNSSIDRDYD